MISEHKRSRGDPGRAHQSARGVIGEARALAGWGPPITRRSVPPFDDLVPVMPAAASGNNIARVSIPDASDAPDHTARLGLALNQLLDAFALRAPPVERDPASLAAGRVVRLTTLYNAGIMGIIVGTLEGHVIDVNDTLLDILGYSRQEILSGERAWASLTPPEWRDVDATAISELLSSGVGALPRKRVRAQGWPARAGDDRLGATARPRARGDLVRARRQRPAGDRCGRRSPAQRARIGSQVSWAARGCTGRDRDRRSSRHDRVGECADRERVSLRPQGT